MATLITVDKVTDNDTEGTGTFDVLMRSVQAHLVAEYDNGRIVGSEYAQAYVSMVNSTMAQAIQFEMTKIQSGFTTDMAEEQVNTAVKQTALITEQIDLAHAQHLNTEANTKVLLEKGGFR